MFELSVWCEKWVAARHNSVIGNQLLFANNRNRVRWMVLCLSHDGACTDSFENFREISLKRDLSNDITLSPPLFSLVNTFKKRDVRLQFWNVQRSCAFLSDLILRVKDNLTKRLNSEKVLLLRISAKDNWVSDIGSAYDNVMEKRIGKVLVL